MAWVGSVTDRLRLALLACLPHHLVSRLVFGLTRKRTRLKDPLVRWFIRRYGVAMSEAADPDPGAYASFNDFFTRALRDGVRPLAGDERTLACPVDGRISLAGTIGDGTIIQAKGIEYGVASLLGDATAAQAFNGGGFATIYLAPGDYHRIHMPITGRLQQMTYVPGRLYSVAPWTVRSLPGLFTRNERVCALFDTAHGRMALILVGAINVGAIETTWAGLITPPAGRRTLHTDYRADPPIDLVRGAEVGRFNMGSTVILLLEQAVPWQAALQPGRRVCMGERLAQL